VHKGFLDIDHQSEQRFLSVDCMSLADRGIPNDAGFACDTQRVSVTGHNEKESHIGVFQQVLKAINPMIAESIRDNQCLVVIDFDKTRRITFGRDIN